MDTSGSSAGQVPALNVVFLPAPPTSTATVVEQPSCIAEEYRKVHTGVTDFVDTVGKILRESGHGLDDDRLSKLLFSLGSLPLTSEAELSQNAQQLTCFILTALTVIAEIMKKTVIKHPTSAEPQASSSEGGDHSSMKKVEHKEPQDSSGEGGDHISMKTEEHVKGRPASIVSAKRKEMFDTDPVTVDARVASASSTATLLTQTNREESRDSLEQPYRKKSTRLMRKTADKKGHNAAEGKRQKEDSFITSHSSSTSAVLDQPPSIVPKPEPEDDRVVSSDKTQTKRLKIARRDTSYVARSRLAPRDKAQGNETDCEICGCAPGGTHILKLHMPDCVCKVCNMECNTEKLLEAHMRTHKTAVKKLHVEKKKHVREKKPRVKEKEVCHVCGLSLNKSRMQHHMLRHGSVKDHVCQTCGKAYYDLKALRRHEAVHGGQRYVCPTCGKTSNTQENLSKHAKRCKGAPETFKCQLCPEEFSVKRELDNHMYAHRVAQAEKHACAVCGREYSERFHLTRHMQKAHQAELEPEQPNPSKSSDRSGHQPRTVSSEDADDSDRHSDSDYDEPGARGTQLASTRRGRPRKPLTCDYCPRTFKTRRLVWSHMDLHHREQARSKPRQQRSKKKTVSDADELQGPVGMLTESHLFLFPQTGQTLSGEDGPKSKTTKRGRPSKSLTCDYCPQTFKNRNSVLCHMNYHHRGEKKSRSRRKGEDSKSGLDENLPSAQDKQQPDSSQHSSLDSNSLALSQGADFEVDACIQSENTDSFNQNVLSIREGPWQVLGYHTVAPQVDKEPVIESRDHGDVDSDHDPDYSMEIDSKDIGESASDNEPQGSSSYTQSPPRRKQGRRGKTQKCDFCPERFTGRKQLEAHIRRNHKDENRSEKKSCKRKGPPRMSRWCDFCPKMFTTRYSVVMHMRNVHSKEMNYTPKSYLCSECGHSCQTPTMLKYHMKRHSGVRDFHCTHCTSSFFTQGELKDHTEGVHMGIRPFLCPLCGSAFKRQYALNCHMRAHSGEREHECSVCGKAFKERHQLRRHLTLHSTERPYECQFCQAKYSHKSGLHIHLKRSKACPGSEAEESIQTQLSNISTLQQICIRISTPATSPDNTDPAFSNSSEKHEGTSQRSQPTNCRKRGRPRKSFVCSVCFVSFSVETDLKTHMLDHTVTNDAHESTLQGNQPTNCRKRGRPGKSVCCSVCFLSFSVEADLKTHTLSHTVAQDSHSHESAVQGDPPTNCRKRGRPRKSFCCSVCFLSFSVEADLKTHMLDHSEDASSVCNATPSPVRKKQGRPRKSLSCDFCPQAFINRDQVLRHMHAHHEADLKLQRSLKKDVPKRPVGRPLQSRVCDFCFKVFSRRSAVVSHMRNHHPEQMNYTRKLYTCTECGQSIKSKAGYNRHMLKHQGCRPFSCTQCDKSFYLSRELKTHIIGVHEGVRPYLCAVCGAAFKRGHALHMHMVLHKGVKKHVCQDCGKAFPERFRLNRHMAVHKTEKPYKCEYCPAKYSLNTCLKVHLQRSKFCPGSKAVSQTH